MAAFRHPRQLRYAASGARRAASGLDRTPYKGHRPVSFVSYHTRAISMGIVKADAYTVFYASISAKAKLCPSAASKNGAETTPPPASVPTPEAAAAREELL